MTQESEIVWSLTIGIPWLIGVAQIVCWIYNHLPFRLVWI